MKRVSTIAIDALYKIIFTMPTTGKTITQTADRVSFFLYDCTFVLIKYQHCDIDNHVPVGKGMVNHACSEQDY